MGLGELCPFMGGLWLLAGRRTEAWGWGRLGRWLVISRRQLWCLWADWGLASSPGGFRSLGLSSRSWGVGQVRFVEALAEPGLHCGLYIHAGTAAPGGRPGG
jgi:hypothetical protein